MTFTVKAVYENGTLKLAEPLPLKEYAEVEVTITAEARVIRRPASMVHWTRDPDTLHRFGQHPEQ
jgi:predicted DNA-binding antitoxin AbrB/MazE fold protein